MQFITIDSIDDERVAAYTNLTEIQLRNRLEPERGLFIAESPKVIDRALAAGREPISLLVEEPWIEGMSQTFDVVDKRWGTDIPVYVASPEQLRQLTGYRLHRGALSAMRRWPLPSVEETCRDARRVAVMENIVDHTNVGALMRIGGDDKHFWPRRGLEELRSLGFTTVAMALSDDSISLDELTRRLNNSPESADHIDKLALIFGTEGDGLSRHTIAGADLTVKIPMSHGVDSLNVAASSAVAFYATSPKRAEQ